MGAGHALDPARYFIVIPYQLASGVSPSPHNMPTPQAMGKFPKMSIGDDVRAQHRLLTELFGIEKLALVVGGSMGEQRAYEWAVAHPGIVERVASIAVTARIPLHQRVFVETLIEAITSDPHWNGVWHASGPDVCARQGPDGTDRGDAGLVGTGLSG